MFKNLLKEKFSFCALLSITIIIFSCNNDSTAVATDDTTTNRKADSGAAIKSMNFLHCLRYDSSDFVAMLKKTPRNQKLIFKLFSYNLWETEIKFQLLAYPAQNHSHYGKNTIPDTLTILDNCSLNTTSDSIYVFGNSEIRTRDLENLVIRGRDTLSFSHFKFTPNINNDSLKSRSIIYMIQAVDRTGNVIDSFSKRLRTLISNPSPPATAL